MIGIYNYTVILTYVGMIVGFKGIVYVLNGDLHRALICLMISGICDMFDGKIAFTMDRNRKQKRFGIQIDSLCDLICFGMLPSLIVYSACGKSICSFNFSASYLLCALIRLAWFNTDEEERQDLEESRRKVYLGLPVTAAAFIFPIMFGLSLKFHWHIQTVSSVCMPVTALSFLTPFRLQKPAIRGSIRVWLFGLFGFLFAVLAFLKK